MSDLIGQMIRARSNIFTEEYSSSNILPHPPFIIYSIILSSFQELWLVLIQSYILWPVSILNPYSITGSNLSVRFRICPYLKFLIFDIFHPDSIKYHLFVTKSLPCNLTPSSFYSLLLFPIMIKYLVQCNYLNTN